MPARQPFTTLCQATARDRSAGWSDLHVHTNHSDGVYTPAEVVNLARRSGLAAVAITDHYTLSGVAPARHAARVGLEVIAGVEITAELEATEYHLLGYFLRLDDAPLNAALERLRVHRFGRFREMVDRLRACGVTLAAADIQAAVGVGVPGRRHLAQMLVQSRRVASLREAFFRYLHDNGRVAVPKAALPAADAIVLIRGAGGVVSWAHPTYDGSREKLSRIRDLGLQAIEVQFPGCNAGRERQLRVWAADLDLVVTGGSDCHGPGPVRRALGSRGITLTELEALRSLAT